MQTATLPHRAPDGRAQRGRRSSPEQGSEGAGTRLRRELITPDQTVDRLMAHLRSHVAELRRLERENAHPRELGERRLANAVRDILDSDRARAA